MRQKPKKYVLFHPSTNTYFKEFRYLKSAANGTYVYHVICDADISKAELLTKRALNRIMDALNTYIMVDKDDPSKVYNTRTMEPKTIKIVYELDP